jgi:hypothetical protein
MKIPPIRTPSRRATRASAAVTTAAAAALFPGILGIATGGLRIVFADIEES